jgi:cell division protein FtsL
VLLALVVVSVFGVVAFQAIVVQDQYRLDELQSQILTEQDRAEVLRLEATQLRSPERIEREATERLGLVAPPEIVYLQHDDGDDARAAYDPAEPAPGTTIPPTSGIGQPDPSSTTVPSAGAATDGAAG